MACLESLNKMETLDDLQRNFPPRTSKRARHLKRALMSKLSSVDCFNSSFWTCDLQSKHGCDLDKVFSFFTFLNKKCAEDELIRQTVRQALEKLMQQLPSGSPSYSSLRIYMMIPFCDYLDDVNTGDAILPSYLNSLMNLDASSQDIIVSWLQTIPEQNFKKFVQVFTRLVGRILTNWKKDPSRLYVTESTTFHSCFWLLDTLYKVNDLRSDKLSNDSFYVPQITTCLDIESDHRFCHKDLHTQCEMKEFHFCHYPFLYDEEGKTRLIRCHNALRMEDDQTQDRFHREKAIFKFLVLVAITCLFYLPLCSEWEHPLSGVLDNVHVQGFFHCSIFFCGYSLLGIFLHSGVQNLDGCFDNFLPSEIPRSRRLCALFCCLMVLGFFGFLGLRTLIVVFVLLAIPGALFGLIILVLRLKGMPFAFNLLPFLSSSFNFSSSKLCNFSCVVAYVFCLWKSTHFILHAFGLQAFYATFCVISFLCLVWPMHFGTIKVIAFLFFSGFKNNNVTITVRRDSVLEGTIGIQKALAGFSTKGVDLLKRKLKVQFCGENDTGPGVDRDYFALVADQLLDPSRGLFSSDEESGLIWFQRKEGDSEDLFYYVGSLIGLCIYNSHHISLPLPLALFKKLMNVPVDFADLEEIKPVSARNLKKLLETDGVENLDLTFEVCQEVNGMTVTHELCEGGGDKPVTDSNKQDYIDLMVDFYLNKDKEKEYERFSAGFNDAFDVDTLRLYNFQPFEFRRATIGKEKIDFKKLERDAKYVGYHKNNRTIRSFWKMVHKMNLREGKAFLRYLTGSERMPQTGQTLTILPLIIEGEETSDLMPVAITCSYQLLLPDIPDEKRLKNRLFRAMYGNQSFTSIPEVLGYQLPHVECQALLA